MTDVTDHPHRCPLCAGLVFTPFRAGLARCAVCDLVVNPAVWTAGSAEALEDVFFNNETFAAQPSPWTHRFDRRNAARTRKRLAAVGVTSGRLLEVGVGSGTALADFRQHGFSVEGCDLSAAVCRAVSARHGITMHDRALDQLSGVAPFDVIVMNHVVEHVSDPVAFLRSAAALLRPGGVLHVAVPNVRSWEARLPGWTSYQPYHLIYFAPATLRRAIEAASLRPVVLETHEPFSGWFLAVLRTLLGGRDRGSTVASGAERAGRAPLVENAYRIAMIATGAVLLPVRWLQERLGAGEEAVAVVTGAGAR